MSKKSTPVIEIEEVEEHHPLFEATRKLLLGSIGAVALAQDEIEDFVGKLVERGEIAEKDGRKLVDELTEKGRDAVKKGRTKVQETIKMGRNGKDEEVVADEIPTKADIDALSRKITALSKKIDALKKEQA